MISCGSCAGVEHESSVRVCRPFLQWYFLFVEAVVWFADDDTLLQCCGYFLYSHRFQATDNKAKFHGLGNRAVRRLLLCVHNVWRYRFLYTQQGSCSLAQPPTTLHDMYNREYRGVSQLKRCLYDCEDGNDLASRPACRKVLFGIVSPPDDSEVMGDDVPFGMSPVQCPDFRLIQAHRTEIIRRLEYNASRLYRELTPGPHPPRHFLGALSPLDWMRWYHRYFLESSARLIMPQIVVDDFLECDRSRNGFRNDGLKSDISRGYRESNAAFVPLRSLDTDQSVHFSQHATQIYLRFPLDEWLGIGRGEHDMVIDSIFKHPQHENVERTASSNKSRDNSSVSILSSQDSPFRSRLHHDAGESALPPGRSVPSYDAVDESNYIDHYYHRRRAREDEVGIVSEAPVAQDQFVAGSLRSSTFIYTGGVQVEAISESKTNNKISSSSSSGSNVSGTSESSASSSVKVLDTMGRYVNSAYFIENDRYRQYRGFSKEATSQILIQKQGVGPVAAPRQSRNAYHQELDETAPGAEDFSEAHTGVLSDEDGPNRSSNSSSSSSSVASTPAEDDNDAGLEELHREGLVSGRLGVFVLQPKKIKFTFGISIMGFGVRPTVDSTQPYANEIDDDFTVDYEGNDNPQRPPGVLSCLATTHQFDPKREGGTSSGWLHPYSVFLQSRPDVVIRVELVQHGEAPKKKIKKSSRSACIGQVYPPVRPEEVDPTPEWLPILRPPLMNGWSQGIKGELLNQLTEFTRATTTRTRHYLQVSTLPALVESFFYVPEDGSFEAASGGSSDPSLAVPRYKSNRRSGVVTGLGSQLRMAAIGAVWNITDTSVLVAPTATLQQYVYACVYHLLKYLLLILPPPVAACDELPVVSEGGCNSAADTDGQLETNNSANKPVSGMRRCSRNLNNIVLDETLRGNHEQKQQQQQQHRGGSSSTLQELEQYQKELMSMSANHSAKECIPTYQPSYWWSGQQQAMASALCGSLWNLCSQRGIGLALFINNPCFTSDVQQNRVNDDILLQHYCSVHHNQQLPAKPNILVYTLVDILRQINMRYGSNRKAAAVSRRENQSEQETDPWPLVFAACHLLCQFRRFDLLLHSEDFVAEPSPNLLTLQCTIDSLVTQSVRLLRSTVGPTEGSNSFCFSHARDDKCGNELLGAAFDTKDIAELLVPHLFQSTFNNRRKNVIDLSGRRVNRALLEYAVFAMERHYFCS